MKRAFAALGFLLAGYGSAPAGNLALLGAGGAGAVAPANCSAFLPSNFATSALYISWTTADGLGSFGKACLNGTTPVAASTLGSLVPGAGSASVSAAGLDVSGGGKFLFSDVSWMSQQPSTLYANLSESSLPATAYAFTLSNGTANLNNLYALRNASGVVRGVLISGGSLASTNSGFTLTVNVPYKVGYSYTATAQIIYVNGTTTATTAFAVSVSGLTAAIIGSSPTGTLPFSGTITEIGYFATALNAGTTPTLQAITQ